MEKIHAPAADIKHSMKNQDIMLYVRFVSGKMDPYQRGYPNYEGGANSVPLKTGQQNFINLGACNSDMIRYTRFPNQEEPNDLDWKELE